MTGKTSDNPDQKAKDLQSDDPDSHQISAPFLSLFRYSSGFDKLLISIGLVFSIAIGAGTPAIMIFYGKLTDTFVEYAIYDRLSQWPDADQYYRHFLANITDKQEFLDKIMTDFSHLHLDTIQIRLHLDNQTFADRLNETVFQHKRSFADRFTDESDYWSFLMLGVSAAFLVCGYVLVATFSTAARNQTHRIRVLFFEAVLRQDITWFDTKASDDFASKVTADLDLIQQGIGDKVALCVFSFSTVLFSLGTAFYYGWELTLIILSISPILVISFSVVTKIQARYAITEAISYGKAGAVAEEVLGAIRTVYAFDGQQKEIQRYDRNLGPAKKAGVKRTVITAIGGGMIWLCVYGSYGLAFWYGVRLIVRSIQDNNQQYEASTLLIIFMTVLMANINLGQAQPYFEAFAQARGAAALIFEVIERKPHIDSSSETGDKIVGLEGRVEFCDAHFAYPARPAVPVLNGLTMAVEPGQTVALVGASGCGKSTVIQLVQRFYDVSSGQVLIDGRDIRDLNVGWLRDRIGVVGQEPVLFGCSIADNIKLGYSAATQADVESASVDANADDFIRRLPHQFATIVGERGGQLSGGQKQRIAIARALVRRPKILLLDESTSALDTQSEAVVQAALDRASVGRTTVIVAHRLSTVRYADKIFVINSGRVAEVGTHEELMHREGLYYKLVQTQHKDMDNDNGADSNEHQRNDVSDKRAVLSRGFSVESDRSGRDLTLRPKQSVVETDDEDRDESSSASLRRLFGLLKDDKLLAFTGSVMAFLMGLIIPAFATVFGQILNTLSQSSTDQIEDDVLLYSMLFVAIGVAAALLSFAQMFLFGICGERLTMRLRRMVFTAMLRQEVAWFDDTNNSTGALCSRLSSDASSVKGAAGSRLSTLCQAAATLGAGVVLALYYSWKLGLVISCFIPLVIMSSFLQLRITGAQVSSDKKSKEEASRIAVEAISCVRTVASLHQEKAFIVNYMKALETQFKKSRITAHLRGISFGIAQSMGNFSYAIALFYGSRLIVDGQLEYGNLFKCVQAVIFGTTMVGQAVAFAPDYQTGRKAAVNIFKLLDRVPKIRVDPMVGEKPLVCNGNVSFRNIEFTYPTRADTKILRGLTFDVQKGQTVALVGASGCGKSTIIQLMQRFYDPDVGHTILDNKNIVNLNIQWLRRKLGIVSQEPVLFGYSIAENIAYGDNSRAVSLHEIIRASERANIHAFIKSLPMGYDTPVGDRGAQLSGGQKQRIAIARALVREPDVLLLDEATSALDSESEKVVQQALDEAREGRTCIVIAHRLSTIQNADKIVVVSKGRVVEEGSHHQLIAKRGAYYDLYNVQSSVI